jgi:hypothetical protein
MSEELSKSPRNLSLPAEYDWPTAVKKSITEYEKSWKVWAEANTALAVAVDDLAAAVREDAVALTEAVKNSQPDPGVEKSDQARRAVVYAEEVAKQARQAVNRQAEKTWNTIAQSHDTLARQAITEALDGVNQFQGDCEAIAEHGRVAELRRSKSLQGLRLLARLGDTRVSFEPSFPIDGQFSVPKTHETRVVNLAALITRLLDEPPVQDVA